MKLRRLCFLFLIIYAGISCNWMKQKSKNAIHGAGEAVGTAGSEFTQGVAKGITTTYGSDIVLSGSLSKAGLSVGRVTITGADSGNDNKLEVYLIFNSALDRDVCMKVFDADGREYGRVTQHVSGGAGQAKYVDFVFDPRTDITGKSKITLE